MKTMFLHAMVALVLLSSCMTVSSQTRDSERLGMALEYFASGKYHESLLILERLDKQYTLNERFHAYMGICYFHEWDYAKAITFLERAMPSLEVFAPHERSVYYYTTGESHFQLEHFAEAIPWYERTLTVCYDNEKAHIHYRLGFCHMFLKDWEGAVSSYRESLSWYELYPQLEEARARIAQIKNILKGCEHELRVANDELRMRSEEQTGIGQVRDVHVRDTIQADSVYTIDLQKLYEQKIEVGE
ncbi:MAG: tetratricopeptide repeat protein [Prevotella sp.]|nr:tetratricopeptide repeat protein [Prevotella sp.]